MSADHTLPELLTIGQLSTYLSVHPETVRAWIARGDLPHLRISPNGRRPVLRFRREEVEEWLDGMAVGSAGPGPWRGRS